MKKVLNFSALLMILLALAAMICFLGGCSIISPIINPSDITDTPEQREEAERKSIINATTFREGVSINGVAVGGMTYDEARSALLPLESELLGKFKYMFVAGENTYTLSATDLGVTVNLGEVLNAAFNICRTGTLAELKAELESIKTNGRDFPLRCIVSSEGIDSTIRKMTSDVYIAPVDATVEINKDDRDNRFTYVDGKDGQEIDREALVEMLNKLSAQSALEATVDMPVKPISPSVTVDDLKALTTRRAFFGTSYSMSNSNNRVHNIKKASGLINGVVVAPGEEFSTNDVLGPRRLETGWLPATAIILGGAGTEDQPGGGVCQVSTTLYNAVVMSDLEIVYRRGHSRVSAYIPGGRDATIDTGNIDFIWKNNTEHNIYVFSWVSSSKEEIYCEIYGEPFPDTFDAIDFISEKVEEIEPTPTEYIELASLYAPYWKVRNAARKGYIYESFAVYYKNDVEVKRVSLGKTKYNMHPTRIYVWPGYVYGTPLDPLYEIKSDQ